MRNTLYKGITHHTNNHAVRPRAWVYFIWAVMDKKIYCKIGFTNNPEARTSQVSGSLPTIPFFLQLLPCLSSQQAKLFEKMLHHHLQAFRTKPQAEWFGDPNFNRLYNKIQAKIDEIVLVASTFGYILELQEIDRLGPYPVLYSNGYINYIVDPRSHT